MTWKFGRQSPDTNLMRFVARRLGWDKAFDFLDIGSGEGANARELEERGHNVFSIDKDRGVSDEWGYETWGRGHACVDVCEWETQLRFDLIYDINTLCHVENPPFEKIKNWLKPGGYFFSICPTSSAPERVKEGKSYTRLSTYLELHDLLRPIFQHNIQIRNCSAPDFCGNQLVSWIVEARA